MVVVTLDTLRADRLGCYGFKGAETPNIDTLAREGVLFEAATATVPLTFPAHSTIFTGLLPPHHGVRDNGGFFLEDKETTLAERLKAAGYATGAFIGAWVLESRWGLAQGFDEYSDKFDLSQYKVLSLGTVQKPGDEVMGNALALARLGAESEVLRLGPSLRPARALRPSGALPLALCRPALQRRDRLHRPCRRPSAGLPPRTRPDGAHPRRAHGRPRREPGRTRRVHPRLLHLRRHHPRAADHQDALGSGRPQQNPGRARSTSSRPCSISWAFHRKRRSTVTRWCARCSTRALRSLTRRIRRPTSRAITSAGSTCARCATALSGSWTPRRRSSTTWRRTRGRRPTSTRPTASVARRCGRRSSGS